MYSFAITVASKVVNKYCNITSNNVLSCVGPSQRGVQREDEGRRKDDRV